MVMKKAIKILAATILSALFITAAHFSAVQIRTNADWYPDDTLTEETAVQSALNTPPAVIADVTSADILESLKSGDKPVQAILTIGADGRVKGADGEDICDLSVALDEYLQKTILPVFRVDDSSADILLNWFKTDRRITDASVSSSSPEAVKKIKTVYPALRGIVEFDESADIKKAAATANAACAQICILPESAASYDAVRYVQARFKTVWVRAEKNDRISIKNCVASGCFGVIAEDVSLSCATLKEYAGGIVRTPYNVAHRGLPNKYNENSVSGTLAAIRAGATHVELDCYLTQDNEIAFMHDANLARTSTGSGNIEDYTSAQLENFRLKQFTDEKIPLLEDIGGALEGSGVVLVLEIKSAKTDVAHILAEKLGKDNLAFLKDYLTVISFDRNQLLEMKEALPEIPTADLGGKSSDDLQTILTRSGQYNCGVDYNFNAIDKTTNARLISRGFIPWTWTYSGEVTIISGLESGIPAMTNNDADALTAFPEKVTVANEQSSVPAVGAPVKLVVTEYGGEEKIAEGKATEVADLGDGRYEVLAEYDPSEYYLSSMLYTQKQTVTVEKKKSGCGSAIGGIPLALTLLPVYLSESKRKFTK